MIINLGITSKHISDTDIWSWIMSQALMPRIVSFVKGDSMLSLYVMSTRSEELTGNDLEDMAIALKHSLVSYLESRQGIV